MKYRIKSAGRLLIPACAVAFCLASISAKGQSNNLLRQLQNPITTAEADFGFMGWSVLFGSKEIYVGMPGVDIPGNDGGTVVAYDSKAAIRSRIIDAGNLATADEVRGVSLASTSKHLVVGAPHHPVNGVGRCGRVYVHSLSGGTPLFVDNPSPGFDDHFGESVAVYNDRLVIVATEDDTVGGISRGSQVYYTTVYNPQNLVPLEDPQAGPDENAHAGRCAAMNGAFIFVGRPQRKVGADFAVGAITVFSTATGGYVGTINNPDHETGARFGQSVALAGNYLIVGCPDADVVDEDDTDLPDAGRVDIFNATTRQLIRSIKSSVAASEFGFCVASNGKSVVIGAPDALNVGRVYVHDLLTGARKGWNNSPNPTPAGQFGFCVAMDKAGRYLVGGWFEDNSTNLALPGNAYLYGGLK